MRRIFSVCPILRRRLAAAVSGGIKRAALFEITGRAKALVFYVVFHINGHLRALEHKFAVHLAPVEHGLAPAGADGFHLFDVMGKLKKAGRAGKAL